ncbi:Phosphoribosyltransferase-like [Sesbania bispinosa]|nr:Phosphoribosyltransferase-like [Sesbania bispinosa]
MVTFRLDHSFCHVNVIASSRKQTQTPHTVVILSNDTSTTSLSAGLDPSHGGALNLITENEMRWGTSLGFRYNELLLGDLNLVGSLANANVIGLHVGIEARGFMFGPAVALGIGAKFVPLRKPGKLPGEVIAEKYSLEYGTDCLQLHVGAVQPGERAIVVDDLVATGGTLSAGIRLLERVGAEVVECACVIGVPEVKVIQKLKILNQK